MAERPPVQVSGGGSARPPADLLASGSDREAAGWWRRISARGWAALTALLAVAAALVVLVTDAGRPPAPAPPPLAELGAAIARVDDGGLLVRVEAPLRSREPVVLRSGTAVGDALVVLVDPVPTPEPGAPDAVTSRVVALVEPGCADRSGGRRDSVLQVVVAPQDGGDAAALESDVPVRALDAAIAAACAPVRASATLPPGGGPVAEQLDVAVRLADASVPVRVVALTGRGFQVDAVPLAEQVGAAAAAGRPSEVTATVRVSVSDCFVEVLAPRRLVLEVQRGEDRLRVPVAVDRAAVAALDELVRQSCRRARG